MVFTKKYIKNRNKNPMMIQNANKNKYKTFFLLWSNEACDFCEALYFVRYDIFCFLFSACLSEKDCHLVSN